MNDITHKIYTRRSAHAQAEVILGGEATATAIRENRVPKGNIMEMARAAALLGIKRTSDVIPDCHPLPVEQASVEVTLEGGKVLVNVMVQAIYRTGVEVEAMHGAAVGALTIYDMLKPIDKAVHIGTIRLIEKRGGKSQFKDYIGLGLKAAVIVCSDSISAGTKTDKAGVIIQEVLGRYDVMVPHYFIIPDEPKDIADALVRMTDDDGMDLVLMTGGTGLSPRDCTPETVRPLLDREIPGIMEASRAYGQERTPYAMLSRGVAGMRGKSLVLTLPGSTGGVRETMDALFPYILHVFKVAQGFRHD